MRRKLLQLNDISNNQKINQIFSHEININKKIKKVTSLDTNIADLDEFVPKNNNNILSILGNIRHYRFKYIFVPPRGDNIVVNSANLMQIGFLYSQKEEYDKYFQNPNYSLLIYTPIFQDYYLKIEQVIWANAFDKYLPIINFYINNLKEEFPIVSGEISSVNKQVNYTLMKEYYLQKYYKDDLEASIWNVSEYQLKKLLNDKGKQSEYFRKFYRNNKNNNKFKCQYWWINENKKQFIILNKINEKVDIKVLKKLKIKMQEKIDKVLTTLASTLLIKKL